MCVRLYTVSESANDSVYVSSHMNAAGGTNRLVDDDDDDDDVDVTTVNLNDFRVYVAISLLLSYVGQK